jgi:hypothetical protein
MNTKPLTGERGLQALADFKVEKLAIGFVVSWKAEDFRYHFFLSENGKPMMASWLFR